MNKIKQIFMDADSLGEIRKFAETHTAKETADRFNINIRSFYPYARRENIRFIRERKPFPVSAEELAEYLKTHTQAQTAQHFGVPLSTMRSRCKEEGIKAPHARSVLSSRDFWAENKDLAPRDVAKKCGVSLSAVYMARRKFKKELGIKDRKRTGRINGEKKAMMAYLSRKFTLTSIGEAFGCSHEYVRQVADEAGES